MTKHVAIDESRLKAAVHAIQERRRSEISHGLSIRPPIAGLRHNLEKQLQPLFANVGLDTAKIKQIMTKHKTDVRHILEKLIGRSLSSRTTQIKFLPPSK